MLISRNPPWLLCSTVCFGGTSQSILQTVPNSTFSDLCHLSVTLCFYQRPFDSLSYLLEVQLQETSAHVLPPVKQAVRQIRKSNRIKRNAAEVELGSATARVKISGIFQ